MGVLRLLHELAPRHPQAFGHLLQALDFRLAPVKEVALVGDDSQRARARGARRASARISCSRAASPTACRCWRAAPPVDGRAAAYVCEHFACKAPVTEPEELERLLDR